MEDPSDVMEVNPKGYDKAQEAFTDGHRLMSQHLTKGSCVYQYFIVDAEGNTNDCWNHHENRAVPCCRNPITYIRLVTVTDSLPPVITLHNRDGLNIVNYAELTDDNANPFTAGALMTETTTVNGWFIGAIAAATAGIALVALSNKQPAVPVEIELAGL
jgi:hypothetical protein